MLGLLGAMVTDPIIKVGWLSVSGTQLFAPLAVFQTPPPAAATKIVFWSVGLAAMPVTGPEVGRLPGAAPPRIGDGPSGCHCADVIGTDVESNVRSSSASRNVFRRVARTRPFAAAIPRCATSSRRGRPI